MSYELGYVVVYSTTHWRLLLSVLSVGKIKRPFYI